MFQKRKVLSTRNIIKKAAPWLRTPEPPQTTIKSRQKEVESNKQKSTRKDIEKRPIKKRRVPKNTIMLTMIEGYQNKDTNPKTRTHSDAGKLEAKGTQRINNRVEPQVECLSNELYQGTSPHRTPHENFYLSFKII